MVPSRKRGLALAVALVVLLSGRLAQSTELDASALLRSGDYRTLDAHYASVQRKFDAGKITGDQLRDAFRGFYATDSDLASRFDAWVMAYPNTGSHFFRIAGEVHASS